MPALTLRHYSSSWKAVKLDGHRFLVHELEEEYACLQIYVRSGWKSGNNYRQKDAEETLRLSNQIEAVEKQLRNKINLKVKKK